MIKTVGSAGYAHKSNLEELAEKKIPEGLRATFWQFISSVDSAGVFSYDVVKYDKGNLTLIESPDWDYANEPTVAFWRRWKAGEWLDEHGRFNIKYTLRKDGTRVYHSKWQFVAADYSGFDVEAAKKRTEEWNGMQDIDKKRIGNKSYWEELLKKNGISA